MRRRALGLWELAAGVVAVVVLAGAILQGASGIIYQAKLARTHQEMSVILDACRQYGSQYGVWPTLEELSGIMPHAPQVNVWGEPYVLYADEWRVKVATSLPHGRSFEKIEMSTIKDHGLVARLVYDKKRVYAP
jgi:hypothetical protein